MLTYGFEAGAVYQIVQFAEAGSVTFSLKNDSETIGPITLGVPGKHNALNATAAALMANHFGVSWKVIIKSLAHFQGAKRRFEFLGEYNGAEFFDDYAHHPTAISFLLESAKRRFPGKRIVMVFQPHTYSRTGKLLKEFAQSLLPADKLILLDIWASAREKSGYVTIRDLIDEIKKYKNGVEYRGTLDEAANYLRSFVTNKDVVLLVGAGDVYKIFPKLSEDD
jgi:UDP-N-acetylmuramate--alanine ligase